MKRSSEPVAGAPVDRHKKRSFYRMREKLFNEIKPSSPAQIILLDLMSVSTWRWRRACEELATNQAMFAGSPEEVKEKKRLEKQLDTLARTLVKCTTEMTNIRRVNLLEAQRKK